MNTDEHRFGGEDAQVTWEGIKAWRHAGQNERAQVVCASLRQA